MAGPGAQKTGRAAAPARETIRLDKWLWQARFFKSRALAAETAESGHLRINGQPTRKAGAGVAAGDVLTFPQGARIRVVRIVALGLRRGPASEAQMLYLDMDAQKDTPEPLE
ncbi:RNA-binding S4 domain-containing protein [Rhodobacteraceae bacterium HSP-20]|uniref:RNA-binding S4 domain-containing protein n=1 Tax=Paragemmobacter amnigenus TaxID=2852097 RepID=A0ABS6IZ61_9RHOB|nr:RNA-binding S4 domain-containing protein [Rhodobacter amnigenus]MBU9696799.1 RNA-binding S4 domain-containing protein [Rhodobacter amnigenus]MBV4388026.1 RNA-binding S4 domain-containing protein [Rhodobacter amnigenus]